MQTDYFDQEATSRVLLEVYSKRIQEICSFTRNHLILLSYKAFHKIDLIDFSVKKSLYASRLAFLPSLGICTAYVGGVGSPLFLGIPPVVFYKYVKLKTISQLIKAKIVELALLSETFKAEFPQPPAAENDLNYLIEWLKEKSLRTEPIKDRAKEIYLHLDLMKQSIKTIRRKKLETKLLESCGPLIDTLQEIAKDVATEIDQTIDEINRTIAEAEACYTIASVAMTKNGEQICQLTNGVILYPRVGEDREVHWRIKFANQRSPYPVRQEPERDIAA